MADFAGELPPVGNGSLSLEPFSGAFRQPASPVSYPGTQGPDIVYVGIDGMQQIDEAEPFDTSNGALLVLNTSTNINNLSPQPTGNPMPGTPGHARRFEAHAHEPIAVVTRTMTWMHPPPLNPKHLDRMRAWQKVAHGHRVAAP